MPHLGKHPGIFTRIAKATSNAAGHPAAFLMAAIIVIVWAASGPLFHFGDTWQLVINTGTTIVTFLMVFLIQNSQNRDTDAMHIKLDELISVIKDANDALLNLEELDQKELEKIRKRFLDKAARAADHSDLEAAVG